MKWLEVISGPGETEPVVTHEFTFDGHTWKMTQDTMESLLKLEAQKAVMTPEVGDDSAVPD